MQRALTSLRAAISACRDEGVGDDVLGHAALAEAMPLLVSVYGPARASAMLKGLSDLAAAEKPAH
jgi:hypothetical protein